MEMYFDFIQPSTLQFSFYYPQISCTLQWWVTLRFLDSPLKFQFVSVYVVCKL